MASNPGGKAFSRAPLHEGEAVGLGWLIRATIGTKRARALNKVHLSLSGEGMRTSVLVGVWVAIILLTVLVVGTVWANTIHEQAKVTELWEPVPRVVATTDNTEPPGDAIVLLGKDGLSPWASVKGGDAKWDFVDGVMTVVPGTGDIISRESFGDIQLHIEWRSPEEVVGESQGRGNSGVFLMSRYEVQILDSFENETYPNGQAASVYKQHIPLVNAARPPGVWQTYDIIFRAPQFTKEGRLRHPATVTVLHNGVLVQDHVTVQGRTQYVGKPNYKPHGDAPIRLQDHSNPVSFRNIWVRRL